MNQKKKSKTKQLAQWLLWLWMGVAATACIHEETNAPEPTDLSPRNELKEDSPSATPASLQQAHQAYLRGDTKELVQQLKATLVEAPNDTVIQQNALSLFSAAFARQPKLPADWQMPKVFLQSEFLTRRGHLGNQIIYHSALRIHSRQPGIFRQLQLIAPDGKSVLDLVRKNRRYYQSYQPWNRTYLHEFYVLNESKPLTQGLYRIHIELKDGTVTKGWFVVDARTYSSAFPELTLTKQPGTSQPMAIQLQAFQSPQFRRREKRTLFARIVRLEQGQGKANVVWSHWSPLKDIKTLPIKKTLPSGRYRLFVGINEKRKFGPLILSRVSNKMLLFSIP